MTEVVEGQPGDAGAAAGAHIGLMYALVSDPERPPVQIARQGFQRGHRATGEGHRAGLTILRLGQVRRALFQIHV